MRLSSAECRSRFGDAAVARLATVGADGAPHLVPIVFAVDGDTIFTAVDAKPKRTTALRRLANIRAEPRVALLADHYGSDWSTLWWVRADGTAHILDPAASADGERIRHGLDLLVARYAPYQRQRPPGPVIAITVNTWSGWTAA